MKRLMTMILLVAVMVTSITVPEKKAVAKYDDPGVTSIGGVATDIDDGHYREADSQGTIVYEEAEIQYRGKSDYSDRVTVGFSEKFDCYTDDGFTEITWSTSDTNIATVSGTGKNATVTGKKAGKVTIIAQLAINGQKVTKDITVLKNQTESKVTGIEGGQRTDFVSYDNKGNLVWTIKIKNDTGQRYLYVMGIQKCILELNTVATKNYHIKSGYNKKYKINGFTSDLSFDLKRGKSKTIKITVKKSKLKKKYQNMNLAEESNYFSFVLSEIKAFEWKYVKKARKKGIDITFWN